MRGVLGFDGGGTKTECVLIDEGRNVLARAQSGASNPGRIGFERASEAIRQVAELAIGEAGVERGAIVALCAGIAGTGDPKAAELMRRELVKMFPGVKVKICTDLEIALFAVGQVPAIVLIAGTGSAAVGRGATGGMRRAGGLGPQVGDEGSAADIGRKALMAAKLHRDHTGGESALGKELLRQLEVVNKSEQQEIFPRLFPVLANAADTGDQVARRLLREAAGELAALVKALVEELKLTEVPFGLAKTGGMIGRSSFFDAELDACLRESAPNATIGVLPISPAHAAALIALELISGPGTASDSND
jgi:glucosamine kinase